MIDTDTGLDPRTLRKVLYNDYLDAVDDYTGDVPRDASDMTTRAIATLLAHVRRNEAYLLMLEQTAKQIEGCRSAQDAAATVLAQPSLRERLGRAPLGGEVTP